MVVTMASPTTIRVINGLYQQSLSRNLRLATTVPEVALDDHHNGRNDLMISSRCLIGLDRRLHV